MKFKPSIRVTGVFKGAGVLQRLINTGDYHVLPTVDVHLGIALGAIDPGWAESMRVQLPADEYIRQLLCRNIQARNWIWEEHIRRGLGVGLEAGLERAGPLPGERYKRRGLISFGYDHTGHGERPEASKSALVVCEQVGNWVVPIFVKHWEPGVDDKIIGRDLVALWAYFWPDYAIGDAFGIGMLTWVCDELFRQGLTHVNRTTVDDGNSTASAWAHWPFAPLRFDGMVKHIMASAVREIFHHGRVAIPYVDTGYEHEDPEWLAFVQQVGNMKALPTKVSYSSFQMVDQKIGDDFFDALCAAVYALATRGLEDTPAVIETRKVDRAALLGGPAVWH